MAQAWRLRHAGPTVTMVVLDLFGRWLRQLLAPNAGIMCVRAEDNPIDHRRLMAPGKAMRGP
jgi:hypothetical protein